MKKLIYILCGLIPLLTACSDKMSPSKQLMANPEKVRIDTIEALETQLAHLQYSQQDWRQGVTQVPRLTFNKVTPKWQNESKYLPVEQKKSIFLRMILPLILIENENILHERELVNSEALNSQILIDLAIKYRVIKTQVSSLQGAHKLMLKQRVNIVPPSLALAQAAEESGWGTSRFVIEGNAFFGQWDFSGNGIKPKQQRKELGNYGIARFDSPLASVQGYMLNINTGAAYEALRQLRAAKVKAKQAISGYGLALGLSNYSERGEHYVQGIQHLITYNKLQGLDKAKLSDNRLVHIIFD